MKFFRIKKTADQLDQHAFASLPGRTMTRNLRTLAASALMMISTLTATLPTYAAEAKDYSFVAIRGTDNCLYINTLDAEHLAWDFWSGWQKVNTPCNLASAPAIAGNLSYLIPTAHVIYRRNDNRIIGIFTKDVSSGKQPKDMVWSSQQDLGGTTYDAPALVRVPDRWNGHLAAYVRGGDNVLYMKTLATGNENKASDWTAWKAVPGTNNMGSAPTVTMYNDQYNNKFIQLVYTQNNNNVTHGWQQVMRGDGTQVDSNYASVYGWGFESLGCCIVGAPAGAQFLQNSYLVFGRGTDNNLWYRPYWPGRGFNNWMQVPGASNVASGITTLVRPSRNGPQMHVFYRDTGGTVQHFWWDKNWNMSRDNIGCCSADSPSATLSTAPYYP